MENFLISYAHPNPESFNAVVKNTVIQTLEKHNINYEVIDL